MPVVEDSGTPRIRTFAERRSAVIAELRTRFGAGVNNPANSIRKLADVVLLGSDALEQDLADWMSELDPRSAGDVALDAHLWPIFERRGAKAAAGIVYLNYTEDGVPTIPTPLFAAGDIDFLDAQGKRYSLVADVDPPAKLYESTQTGTPSEAIGSGTSRIAFRVPLEVGNYPQAIRVTIAAVAGGTPLLDWVRIEADDGGGSPVNSAYKPSLEKVVGDELAVGQLTIIIPAGAIIDTEADYWVVLQVSGGTVTFDGGVGGVANQVKVYSAGAWAVSSAVENLNAAVFEGGRAFVKAAELGAAGNIEEASITGRDIPNPTVQSRFDTIVASYSNLEAFVGGSDRESRAEFRARARRARSARGTSSPGGIVEGMTDGTIAGVLSADIEENHTDEWTSVDTVLDNSDKTGAASETIDGTTTRISQKFVVAEHTSAVSGALDLATDAGLVGDVAIQADTAGSASGVDLVVATGYTPGSTARVTFEFDDGELLPPGTYHWVFRRTAGSGTFEGSAAGATNNVKVYSGAWALSANVEDIRIEIFGGLPPHSFRLYVEGGADDVVAQGIYGLRAPGIYSDGPESGTALDVAGRDVTVRFARPVDVPVVVYAEADVLNTFSGSLSDLKDLLKEYINGELRVSQRLVFDEAKARLLHGDDRTIGVARVPVFRIGRRSAFPTPGDLTGAEVIDLVPQRGERFSVQDDDIFIDPTDVTE